MKKAYSQKTIKFHQNCGVTLVVFSMISKTFEAGRQSHGCTEFLPALDSNRTSNFSLKLLGCPASFFLDNKKFGPFPDVHFIISECQGPSSLCLFFSAIVTNAELNSKFDSFQQEYNSFREEHEEKSLRLTTMEAGWMSRLG